MESQGNSRLRELRTSRQIDSDLEIFRAAKTSRQVGFGSR
jgi:hypothetical protein